MHICVSPSKMDTCFNSLFFYVLIDIFKILDNFKVFGNNFVILRISRWMILGKYECFDRYCFCDSLFLFLTPYTKSIEGTALMLLAFVQYSQAFNLIYHLNSFLLFIQYHYLHWCLSRIMIWYCSKWTLF